jgi:hypothetical protein
MKAKDKAKELVDKFKIRVTITFSKDSVPCVLNAPMIKESAKKCALICVDEILVSLYDIEFYKKEHAIKIAKYWQKIKQEINKL